MVMVVLNKDWMEAFRVTVFEQTPAIWFIVSGDGDGDDDDDDDDDGDDDDDDDDDDGGGDDDDVDGHSSTEQGLDGGLPGHRVRADARHLVHREWRGMMMMRMRRMMMMRMMMMMR
jgi:hypothetical protein